MEKQMGRTPGIYEDIPNEIYHSDTEFLSSSQLKVALQSPYHYKYYVLDKKGPPKKSTAAKDFGTLCHTLILEPDTFSTLYAVLDMSSMDMRKTKDKEAYAAFSEEHAGKTVISEADYKEALVCKESVYSHQDARRLLELPGLFEASVYYIDEVTLPTGEIVQFKGRVRPDKLCTGHSILDLKTSKNPAKEAFIRDAFSPWGYHYDLSGYQYKRAVKIALDMDVPFNWIVVKNDAPYEVAVYSMSLKTEAEGEKKFKRSLYNINLAEREGVWAFQERMEEI